MDRPPEPYQVRAFNLEFLMRSQWWNKEKLEELQLEGLKNLVDFATEHCPYYTKQLQKIEDLHEISNLPILTKSLINKHFDEILVPEVPHVLTTTGGTVSKVTVAGDKRLLHGYEEIRFMNWYPLKALTKYCYLWGSVEVGQEAKKINNKLWLPVENLRNETVALDYLYKIRDFKPHYIKAYAGPMHVLAHYALKNNVRNFHIGVIATHCETLLPEMRKDIEAAFNCEVFNFYGARDLGSQAQDCNIHKDLHLCAERYIVEVVDGKFLFTDLFNYASPLIRYENQDVGESVRAVQVR